MANRYRTTLLCFALIGCGPSIENDTEPDALERPVWSLGPPTTGGPMAAVCIPLEPDQQCLRMAMVIDVSGQPTDVSGAVVGPGCVVDREARPRLERFEGMVYTGHGGLWMMGTAYFDDDLSLPIDIEAVSGECEL